MTTQEEYESFWGKVEMLSDNGSGAYEESYEEFSSFYELIEKYNSLKAKGLLPRYPKANGAGYSIRFSSDLSMCSITLELDKLRTNESKFKILDTLFTMMEKSTLIY